MIYLILIFSNSRKEYDFKKADWGIFIHDLPEEYKENNDLKLYSSEYIKWLEDKYYNK